MKRMPILTRRSERTLCTKEGAGRRARCKQGTRLLSILERVQFLRQRKQPDREVFDVLTEVFRKVRRDQLFPSQADMYLTLQVLCPRFFEQHQLIMRDISRFLDLYYYRIDERVVVPKEWTS